MTNLEKLKQTIHQTKSLIDEPELGLMSWNGCLQDRLNELEDVARQIKNNGPTAEYIKD